MKKIFPFPAASSPLLAFVIMFACTCIFPLRIAFAEDNKTAKIKKKVVLAADDWCPYNCEPSSARPGYVIELAKIIFEKKGYSFDYTMIPWEQAKADALHGRITGAIGMDKKEGEETEKQEDPSGKKKFQYPQNEITVNTSCFFVLKENNWKFDSANPDKSLSALGGKVGIAQGYAFDLRDKLLEKNMLMEVGGTSPLRELLLLLLDGKIKALIDDRNVVTYKVYAMKCARKIQSAGIAEEPAKLYIGFCPDCREEAAVFSQGIDELRATGKLKAVLSSYYLDDWKSK
jgi:polar amino acid transport system substrate-binding protein